MGKEKEPFKRINFFRGFATTAHDWNEAEAYHRRKRALHNRFLHTAGIIPDYPDGLKVTAKKNGKGVKVSAGCAIDTRGRELLLPYEEERSLDDAEPGQKVFVVLEYHEEKKLPEHHHPNPNPEYEGYKFIEESAKVRIKKSEPDFDDCVELARIRIGTSPVVIREAVDPENPKDNEIDIRYVRQAGAFTRRVRRADVLEKIDKGHVNVPVSKPVANAEDEDAVEIILERGVSPEEALRLYLVAACSNETQAWISWNIVRKPRKDVIDYLLYFRNQGTEPCTVDYEIYRILD